MNDPTAYLTVASILSGFGVTVLMFRIQRELDVREKHPDWPSWLAWADYLVIVSTALSLLLVVLPLVAVRNPNERLLSVAAASCASAAILLTAYIPAILDHYRIEIGTKRTAYRHRGEPWERLFVIGGFVVAALAFGWIVGRGFC